MEDTRPSVLWTPRASEIIVEMCTEEWRKSANVYFPTYCVLRIIRSARPRIILFPFWLRDIERGPARTIGASKSGGAPYATPPGRAKEGNRSRDFLGDRQARGLRREPEDRLLMRVAEVTIRWGRGEDIAMDQSLVRDLCGHRAAWTQWWTQTALNPRICWRPARATLAQSARASRR